MSVEDYDRVLVDQSPRDDEANPSVAAKPLRIELRDVTESLNRDGEVVLLRPTAPKNRGTATTDGYEDIALLIRRRINNYNEPLYVRLEIRSSIIQRAVQECCPDGFWINAKVKPGHPIIVQSPYIGLFQASKEIKDYTSKPERTEEELRHLKLLVDFMDKQFKGLEKEHDRLVSVNKVTYDLYWTLFQPYEPVVVRYDNYIECFRLQSFRILGEKYLLDGLGWDFDSGWFGPTRRRAELSLFEGPSDITNLSVYPLRFHPSSALALKLADRGRRWAALLEKAHVNYEGVAWEVGSRREYSFESNQMIHVNGRIILDYDTFCAEHPVERARLDQALGNITDMEAAEEVNESTKESTGSAEDQQQDPKTAQLMQFFQSRRNTSSFTMSDDLAMLCPAHAVSRLEAAPRTKKIIQALLDAHSADQNSNTPFDDVVPGKGQGLVFLFAGEPGLGKTMTAECFTEQNRKPLYTITSGELGTDTVTTDDKLRKLFKLARTWGAYLLLDEADVFLARRNHSDLMRNGLVTIFLRQIEYYGGVIFLTTNRLKEFDPAFESRIHFKVFFEPLTPSQRSNIWKNLVTDWNADGKSRQKTEDWSEETFSRLGRDNKLNGRQIRNLIKNALALAQMEKRPLSERHLLEVSEANQLWAMKTKESGEVMS
ncbi:hypothetical protein PG987_010358 [Apiospora arundinis]